MVTLSNYLDSKQSCTCVKGIFILDSNTAQVKIVRCIRVVSSTMETNVPEVQNGTNDPEHLREKRHLCGRRF